MRVLIFFALLGAALAVPNKIQKIVGGTPTEVEQYPYMSNIQYAFWGIVLMHSCGGTLITSSAVLSAANCFFGYAPFDFRVRLGTSLASSGGTVHDVSQIIIHPNYSDYRKSDDVAIIRLSTPAVYSTSVQPAGIAGSGYNIPDNTDVVTMGWGSLTFAGFYQEQLQHVTVQTINQEVCAERYAYLKTLPDYVNWPDITDDMLCAGVLDVGDKDACMGDEGGPLVHNNNVIVGIVSWRFGCAFNYYPGVYSRISANVDWIVANGAS